MRANLMYSYIYAFISYGWLLTVYRVCRVGRLQCRFIIMYEDVKNLDLNDMAIRNGIK